MDIGVETRITGDVAIVAVVGELDISTAPELRGALVDAAAADPSHVVVDLTELEFLDSTGLGVIIGAFGRAKEAAGTLRVVCPQERFRRLFRITGLDGLMPVDESLEAAMASLGVPSA
jgi:anti-sigma B factor antagonist